MKLIRLFAVVAILIFTFINAQAANAQQFKPQFYGGGKLGLMMVDGSGFDDAVNVGLMAGAVLSEVQAGSLAVEGELTFTIVDGDVDVFGLSGDWDIMTLAGYGVYRSNGPLYFKGKAGFLYEDVSIGISGFPGSDGDDFGLSVGIGGGYKVSDKAALELEYTIIESDVDFLSIGFNVNF